ncbi:hypothetical protein RA28_07990 [Ruegeria sp. ANG-S4]|nr:hypothetical protein RA28_07990 [Ruegeria sp. ANG-S4]
MPQAAPLIKTRGKRAFGMIIAVTWADGKEEISRRASAGPSVSVAKCCCDRMLSAPNAHIGFDFVGGMRLIYHNVSGSTA